MNGAYAPPPAAPPALTVFLEELKVQMAVLYGIISKTKTIRKGMRT